jgi:hypothetical protein
MTTQSKAATTVPEPLVREQLATMLAHEMFANAPVLSRFLRFIVEQTLQGHRVTELIILREVFDKSLDVDPAGDQVARGAARRLRDRLREYYSQPLDHKVVITVDKGGYVPTWHLASAPSSADAQRVRLRSEPMMLSREQAKVMIFEHDFYCREWHEIGKGIKHQYRVHACEGALVVIDDATGLMWPRGGSWDEGLHDLTLKGAEQYVAQLNTERWGGFDDWRLPTLPEAMSLMLPKDKVPAGEKVLHLDLVFERSGAKRVWTSDFDSRVSTQTSSFFRWLVFYTEGFCVSSEMDSAGVKAVRANI